MEALDLASAVLDIIETSTYCATLCREIHQLLPVTRAYIPSLTVERLSPRIHRWESLLKALHFSLASVSHQLPPDIIQDVRQTTAVARESLQYLKDCLVQINGKRKWYRISIFDQEYLGPHIARVDDCFGTIQLVVYHINSQSTSRTRTAMSELVNSVEALQPGVLKTTDLEQATELQGRLSNGNTTEGRFQFPSHLEFQSGTNFVSEIGDNIARIEEEELFVPKEGHDNLKAWLQIFQSTEVASPSSRLRVLVFGQANSTAGVTVADKSLLVDVIESLEVPFDIMHRALDAKEFSFRLPRSQNEDWTMGLHYNRQQQSIHALIHGMKDKERMAFANKIHKSMEDVGHPMLLPVIFCELMAAGDLFAVRTTADELYRVETRTGLSGVFDKMKSIRKVLTFHIGKDTQIANEGAQESFEQMTRSLNRAISSLPTREARTQANMMLSQRILEIVSNLKIPSTEGGEKFDRKQLENERATRWQESTDRIKNRLQALKATHEGLLLEIQRESKIASSQLQIVYNLVAQRDNKSNYDMAGLSLEIARTAKEDSFAMFTLATMSILFLPGASIATLLSMDLFNWSAQGGESVVNQRFWVYWALTVPLTVVVLVIWLSWLKMHRRKDGYNMNNGGIRSGQVLKPNPLAKTFGTDEATESVIGGNIRQLSIKYGLWKAPGFSSSKLEKGQERRGIQQVLGLSNRNALVPSAEEMVLETTEDQPSKAEISRSYTSAPLGPRRY